jgi:hypothetical protein
MQTKKWVRVGLAGVVVGSALGGMLAAGCGGNDKGSNNTSDAGDSSAPPGDAHVNDTGLDAEAAAAPPVFAKVYLVHAAVDPNAPPLRFCFGLGNPADGGTVSVADSIPPFPDTKVSPAFPIAGLFPGFGGSVSTSPKLSSFDLSILTISLYAIDATKIAADTADGGPEGGAEVPCEGLIGTDALGKGSDAGGGTLTEGTDYWYLGTIPKGTLLHGTTWVAAVTGCAPGETVDNVPFCGGPPALPTYSATTGNLTLTAWEVDNTTVIPADAGIAAQFGNASPAYDYSVSAAGGTTTAAGFWIATPSVPATDGGLDAGEGGLDGSLIDSGSLLDSGLLDSSLLDSGLLDSSLLDSGLLDSGSLLDSGGLIDASGLPTTTLTFSPITVTGSFAAARGDGGIVSALSPATLNTDAGGIPLNAPNAGFATLIPGPAGTTIDAPPACTVGTNCFSPLLIPLPDIDSVTFGSVLGDAGTVITPAGGSFVYGKGYVFILIGDPNQPTIASGAFNGKSLHFLAFPTSNP